jgi:RNA polymerase sigma-70 factor (ECF subfamily)
LDESDLVQESLLRGYAYLDQFCGSTEAEFRAWLTQILQHQLVSLLRYNSAAKRDLLRESPALDSLAAIAPTPSDDLLQSETRERVNSLLNQLSATQKQVVVWRNEGASFVDIANRMGSTPDAVRMIWGRAVHRLA